MRRLLKLSQKAIYLIGFSLGAIICIVALVVMVPMLGHHHGVVWWLAIFGNLCVALAALICIDGFIDNLMD